MRKKLIEVALPLEAINEASAREKSIRHGHPSTLHLWWARRPLAAARAVIFSQMVDDPSSCPEEFPTEEEQDKERQRLFRLIEELVKWENTTNEKVLQRARDEIWKSWRRTCKDNKDHPQADELFNPEKLPAFHDPFAGGGALPLEAQRLGLEAYASDLNPVAVLINKAMIEIPPKFANMPPVNPEARAKKSLIEKEWKGAEGLAEDVRYYGQWMRDEAEKRIGHLYPKVKITADMVEDRPDLAKYTGQELTVIAWLWARTVKSPNPAFSEVYVPLVSNFQLSTKKGQEAYLEPLINGMEYSFRVRHGIPDNVSKYRKGTKISRGSFKCILSNVPIKYEYIDEQANQKAMSSKLIAIVVAGTRERLYLSADERHEKIACQRFDSWKPVLPCRGTWGSNAQGRYYGFHCHGDYFTNRQLKALTTFADLHREAVSIIQEHYRLTQRSDIDSCEYDKSISLYLSFIIDKCSDYWSSLCGWINTIGAMRNTFARQAIPMVWDYAEANPFSNSTGNWMAMTNWVVKAVQGLPANGSAFTAQEDAQKQTISTYKVVSTDPPYYDNISYSDLSDYFYVWLRRTQRDSYISLFSTLTTPKNDELIAVQQRHGTRKKAEEFFLSGMTSVMKRLSRSTHPCFPITIYYAFKQSRNDDYNVTVNTGWETFLEAIMHSGLVICGTWPMRTEFGNRPVSDRRNALASSVVLVCKGRRGHERSTTRRAFLSELRQVLPNAIKLIHTSNISPTDFAQTILGPGMEVFSQYSSVLDADGSTMSVGQAIALTNQIVDEIYLDYEGSYDSITRWAIAWFDQFSFSEGDFGVAEILSKAKSTSVSRIASRGLITSGKGIVRLLKPQELAANIETFYDNATSWEALHHVIRALEFGGEKEASEVVKLLGGRVEESRELAYRLYSISEKKNRAIQAQSYNAFIQSWPEIARLAKESEKPLSRQGDLFNRDGE